MYSDSTPVPTLQAVFDAAKRFGLADDEAWRALNESLFEVGRDATVSEYLDELTRVLAQRILSIQRQAPSQERRSAREEWRISSEEHL
jgi:hypothetical protein